MKRKQLDNLKNIAAEKEQRRKCAAYSVFVIPMGIYTSPSPGVIHCHSHVLHAHDVLGM